MKLFKRSLVEIYLLTPEESEQLGPFLQASPSFLGCVLTDGSISCVVRVEAILLPLGFGLDSFESIVVVFHISINFGGTLGETMAVNHAELLLQLVVVVLLGCPEVGRASIRDKLACEVLLNNRLDALGHVL